MRLFKIIIILLMLTFTVMFFIENMDPVPMYFPIIKIRKVGLTFILVTSYFMGVLTTLAIITTVGVKARKKRKLRESSEDQEQLFEE